MVKGKKCEIDLCIRLENKNDLTHLLNRVVALNQSVGLEKII